MGNPQNNSEYVILSNLDLFIVGKSLLDANTSAHDEIQGLCSVAFPKYLGPSWPLLDFTDGGYFIQHFVRELLEKGNSLNQFGYRLSHVGLF